MGDPGLSGGDHKEINWDFFKSSLNVEYVFKLVKGWDPRVGK